MKKVVIIATGQRAFVKSETTEFGINFFSLVDEKGAKLWNGNATWFDKSQIEETGAKKTQNLAKAYRQAGIKGMSESKGSTPVKNKVQFTSTLVVLDRLEGESLTEWKKRMTDAKQAQNG